MRRWKRQLLIVGIFAAATASFMTGWLVSHSTVSVYDEWIQVLFYTVVAGMEAGDIVDLLGPPDRITFDPRRYDGQIERGTEVGPLPVARSRRSYCPQEPLNGTAVSWKGCWCATAFQLRSGAQLWMASGHTRQVQEGHNEAIEQAGPLVDRGQWSVAW